MNYVKSRLKENQNRLNVSNVNGSFEASQVEIDWDKQREDLDYLKYCVVNDAMDDTFIQKLNSTREIRKKIMDDQQTDIREHFPFFFVNPNLVSLSFV